MTAAERLKTISQEELCGMLVENADEPYAEEISRAVVLAIKNGKPVETTTQLKEIIEHTLAFLPEDEQKEAVKKSCQRTFRHLELMSTVNLKCCMHFWRNFPMHWQRAVV